MEKQTLKVFVVDDDPAARMITSFQLQDPDLLVREFDNGASCLAATEDVPDIVILDVEMPGADGIAVCRALRASGHAAAQVIFVSAHDDLETRLTAYDAGGNDYIVKPIVPEELARKIEQAKRLLLGAREISGRMDFAQQAAFTAMSSMGEMGVIIEFLRASFNCQTPHELAHALFDALGRYGLHGLLELRDGQGQHCISKQGRCTPLEASILGHMRGLERIFQFRDRVAINYPHTTLLVSDLPLDDPDRIGRLRDHLAVLAEGVEARLLAMASETQRLAQAQSVINAVTELGQTLEDIDAHQENNRIRMIEIAHGHLQALTNAFIHLGLTEQQEEELVALTQASIDRFAQVQDYSASISQRLREVASQLKALVAGESPVGAGPGTT